MITATMRFGPHERTVTDADVPACVPVDAPDIVRMTAAALQPTRVDVAADGTYTLTWEGQFADAPADADDARSARAAETD